MPTGMTPVEKKLVHATSQRIVVPLPDFTKIMKHGVGMESHLAFHDEPKHKPLARQVKKMSKECVIPNCKCS